MISSKSRRFSSLRGARHQSSRMSKGFVANFA
jgi:hypothetical protein